MALNDLICAEVPLRYYSLTHPLTHSLAQSIADTDTDTFTEFVACTYPVASSRTVISSYGLAVA